MTPQVVTVASEQASPDAKENYASYSDRSASPSSDVELLERKTKELDTAKSLIKQMQTDRKVDREALAELKKELDFLKQSSISKSEDIDTSEAFQNVQNQLCSIKEERDTLLKSLEELQHQSAASQTSHDAEVMRLNNLLDEQKKDTLNEITSLKADHDRELSVLRGSVKSLNNALESKIESLTSQLGLREDKIANLESDIRNQSEQLSQAHSQLVQSEKDLESIKLERAADETRFKEELNRISSTSASQLIQAKSEFENQLTSMKTLLSQKEKEIESLNKAIQVETDLKTSLEQRKNELDKRVRAAESKQVELEDLLAASGKLVEKTQSQVKDLEQQVDIVESEKCLLDESLKTITTLKNQLEKSVQESNERCKQLTHKLASTEKQIKAFEDQVHDLKTQVNDKASVVKQFTNDLASLRRASDNKVRNVAVIAAVIAFLIARLIALM